MNSDFLNGFRTVHLDAKKMDQNVLREKRVILGMTQKQAAEKAGVAPVTYQRFESGERNIRTASFQLVCRVLESLEMSADAFYKGDYVIGEEVFGSEGGLRYRKSGKLISEEPED